MFRILVIVSVVVYSATSLPQFGYPGLIEGGGFGFGGGGGGAGFGGGLPFTGGAGYFPGAIGKIGFGGAGGGIGGPGIGFGGAGIGAPGLGIGGPKLGPVVFGGGPLVGEGGEFIKKNVFGEEKKDLKDKHFEAAQGKKGEEFEESQEGFNKGKAAIKNVKADAGAYADEERGKKLAEEGKEYYGGHHVNKQGKNGAEKKLKKGHKKGHVIKGFKHSHHKDEDGKTEEYYDEANDEGEQVGIDEHSGSFGDAEKSSFKGAHADEEFKAKEGKKHGRYDEEHFIDKNNGGGGQFGKKKFGGSGSTFGFDKGHGEESLVGSNEDSKFIKHHPFF